MAGREKKKISGLSYAAVACITIAAVLALLIWTRALKERNAEFAERESQLYEQLEEESSRNDELNEQYDYVKTDDYIKDAAEVYYGLVDDVDVLIKPNN